MAKVPQELATSMKVAYEKRQSEKKRKKLIYIGSAVAVVGIASYFIFKKK
jgi:hypothetical protein